MARIPVDFIKNLLLRLPALLGLCVFQHLHAEMLDGRLIFEAQVTQSTCLLSANNGNLTTVTSITFSLNTEEGKRMCTNLNNLNISVDSPLSQISPLNDSLYLASDLRDEAFTLQSAQFDSTKPMRTFNAKLPVLVNYQ